MLRLRRFLMHHFICVFSGNAYIILINSDFQKQRQVKISVKRRLIGVFLKCYYDQIWELVFDYIFRKCM